MVTFAKRDFCRVLGTLILAALVAYIILVIRPAIHQCASLLGIAVFLVLLFLGSKSHSKVTILSFLKFKTFANLPNLTRTVIIEVCRVSFFRLA